MPAQPKGASRTKKPVALYVIGAIVVLIAASLLYVIYSRPAAAPSTNTATVTTPTDQPTATPQQAGSYVVYSERALQQSTSTRKVLFFHAGWCPQCRAIEKDITEQGVPSGMTIFKVDYDSAHDLKNKYGVTLQTTIVEVDNQGNLIKKHVAYSKPTLPAILEALGD